jgi:hypothetical protein
MVEKAIFHGATDLPIELVKLLSDYAAVVYCKTCQKPLHVIDELNRHSRRVGFTSAEGHVAFFEQLHQVGTFYSSQRKR